MTMQDHENACPTGLKRAPWNKGKLIGAKPPLRPKHVWSIRTKLQVEGRIRDLAMFNLAIDSKLRGCDVVALKVDSATESPAFRADISGEKLFGIGFCCAWFWNDSCCFILQRHPALRRAQR
jgi:hypothetical protein